MASLGLKGLWGRGDPQSHHRRAVPMGLVDCGQVIQAEHSLLRSWGAVWQGNVDEITDPKFL